MTPGIDYRAAIPVDWELHHVEGDRRVLVRDGGVYVYRAQRWRPTGTPLYDVMIGREQAAGVVTYPGEPVAVELERREAAALAGQLLAAPNNPAVWLRPCPRQGVWEWEEE